MQNAPPPAPRPPVFGLQPGLTGEVEHLVTAADTAAQVASGAVEALATPVVLALVEAAAFRATRQHLPEGWTTVGTYADLRHLAPTPAGMQVRAVARLVAVDGRRLVFDAEVRDPLEQVATARHERFVVERERFTARLRDKLGQNPTAPPPSAGASE